MGRKRKQLNEIIDGEIEKLLSASGAADSTDIYNILIDDHDDVVAELRAEHARFGLMRTIEQRLKHYHTAADEADTQMLLPGIPEDLQRRMGRVITVPRENGGVGYHDLAHPNTTLGHVRAHVRLLKSHATALDQKIAAFMELIHRCADAQDATSVLAALRPVEAPAG